MTTATLAALIAIITPARLAAAAACTGASCPGGESVLLQRSAQHDRLSRAARAGGLDCPTCIDVFDQLEGCQAVQDGDDAKVGNLFARPDMEGCRALGCESELQARCGAPLTEAAKLQGPVVNCETCVEVFDQLGGCQALQARDMATLEELRVRPELSGCGDLGCDLQYQDRCGVGAGATAAPPAPPAPPAAGPSCATCAEVFEGAGGCAARQGNDAEALARVLALPEFAGCEAMACEGQIQEICGSEPASLCDASCAGRYEAAGGCTALNNGSFASGMAVLDRPELEGCSMEACGDDIFERCRPEALPEGFCRDCVQRFDAAGGCAAVRASVDGSSDAVTALIPDGCWPCGDEAMEHCMSEAQAGAAAAETCKTASPGDDCFSHVRWAMEHGAELHPEWYEGLTRESSFEAFQQLLHSRGQHGCPRPCAAVPPATLCHTATAGEECHRHVKWAMEVGIRTSRGRYPAALTPESSFQAFQAWLHHIHHGDCQAPCEA